MEWIEDIGGGLDLTHKMFAKIMAAVERHEVDTLVIAHKDRLVRFGFAEALQEDMAQ